MKIDIKLKKTISNLCIIAFYICNKNYRFIKFYNPSIIDKKNISFSIFTKQITNDTFFSIPLGERIIKEGFKSDDVLTWHNDLEFDNDRWLFNIIIYFVYKIWGIVGIANFTTICTIFIGIILYIALLYFTNNKKLSLFSMLFIMYFCRYVFYARAQILSFPLFILEIMFIEKLNNTGKYKYSFFLILIAILIANLHTSIFPIYFVFYLPYFAEWILSILNKKINSNEKKYKYIKKLFKIIDIFDYKDIKGIKPIITTFLIALFSGIITPTEGTPYTVFFKAMFFTDTSFIGECQPSTIYNNRPLFVLLLLIFISIIVFPKYKIKIRDYLFILGFGLMSILVYRSSFFFYFISGICITRIIGDIINLYNIKSNKIELNFLVSICLLLIIGSFYIKQFAIIQKDEYIPKNIYPVNLCDYIINNYDIERIKIYNDFNYGSYLEFRGIKSFIDSRSGVYTSAFNPGCTILEDWNKVFDDSKEYKKVFEKYEISHAITKTNTELSSYLEKDKEWAKVYSDENFELYEKKF